MTAFLFTIHPLYWFHHFLPLFLQIYTTRGTPEKNSYFKMPSHIEIESETRCHDCDTNYVDNSALKEHLRLEHGQSFEQGNL